jgi:hypothetical protein
MNNTIHFPTEEENKATLDAFFSRERRVNAERLAATQLAIPALERLCQVLCDRSGQCYKVRALLWSLYNGQATSLSEVLNLDWEIRQDLCAVILAFGFEGPEFPGDVPDDRAEFFYDAMKAAIMKVRQWEWFIEAFVESGVQS